MLTIHRTDQIQKSSRARSTRWLRGGLVLLVSAAVFLGSQTPALASDPNDRFIIQPDKEIRSLEVAPFAVLEMDNGNKLQFFQMHGEGGRVAGISMTEIVRSGNLGYASIESLREANPLEVFNAFSKRGTSLPSQFTDVYGDPVLGPQNWARDLDLMQRGANKDYPPCPAHAVSEYQDVLAYGQNNYNHQFESTWDGPTAKPQHWSAFRPGNGQIYYKLIGQANSVTGFASSVVLCHKSSDSVFYGGDCVCPQVDVFWRPIAASTTGTWNQGAQAELENAGDVFSHVFYPANAKLPSAPQFDFRLQINWAQGANMDTFGYGDLFHIGAVWQTKIGGLTQ